MLRWVDVDWILRFVRSTNLYSYFAQGLNYRYWEVICCITHLANSACRLSSRESNCTFFCMGRNRCWEYVVHWVDMDNHVTSGITTEETGRSGIIKLTESSYRVSSTVTELAFREKKLWGHITRMVIFPAPIWVMFTGVIAVLAAPCSDAVAFSHFSAALGIIITAIISFGERVCKRIW